MATELGHLPVIGNRPPAIEARGLVKRFDGTLAVNGVDLIVPEGAIYGILGPNGAGKTTTLRMLVFFFATYAMAQPGSTVEMLAVAFPLSSPFAMVARAAQQDALWPHAVALLWQMLAVALFVKGGAALFRKRVMKSGPAALGKRRLFFRRC